MCIAIVKNKGQHLPTETEFRKCFSTNKDGAGIAWLTPEGTVKWIKGLMTIEKFLTTLNSLPDLKETVAMFHFRIGTHGSASAESLTHPFPVVVDRQEQLALEGEGRMVAMHNGVIYKYGSLKLDDEDSKYSDTVNFISQWVAPRVLDGTQKFMDPDLAKELEKEMGYSKFAILGEGGVKTYGTGWIEHNGNLFSNAGFRPYSSWKDSDPRYYTNSYNGGSTNSSYNSKPSPSVRESWRTELRPLGQDELFVCNYDNKPTQYIGADFTETLLVDDFERVFQNFPTLKKKANWQHVGYLVTEDDESLWSYYTRMSSNV